MKGLPTNVELRETLKRLNLPYSDTKNALLEWLGWAELTQSLNIFEEKTILSESNPKNWDLSFSSTGPVIKCIPKASRVQACKNFSEILNDIITKNDVKSWLCLLQYPRYCFGGTVRGGTKTKNQATIINKRIDVYLKETPKLEKHLPRKTAPSLKDQVSTRLNLADVSGTVRVISSSDTVLPPSREVRNKLEEKRFRSAFWGIFK